ncbi:uncharacterized protein BCR38DRAFT_411913 [Pseudomassariella vexata]|uniref:Uncharacterized protein n=1 Tax=Pseudomassariella vexata TaxID=1141098 RepID=A0A1Y2DNT3_9PEZI|nr:uncharacterized protein BCR38DRAFT_411913 [Pseudomassariella vexata]ORY60796.1 hypothetical protein BCR38DRAFT_411913 [Pseudomassariella vexata]
MNTSAHATQATKPGPATMEHKHHTRIYGVWTCGHGTQFRASTTTRKVLEIELESVQYFNDSLTGEIRIPWKCHMCRYDSIQRQFTELASEIKRVHDARLCASEDVSDNFDFHVQILLCEVFVQRQILPPQRLEKLAGLWFKAVWESYRKDDYAWMVHKTVNCLYDLDPDEVMVEYFVVQGMGLKDGPLLELRQKRGKSH